MSQGRIAGQNASGYGPLFSSVTRLATWNKRTANLIISKPYCFVFVLEITRSMFFLILPRIGCTKECLEFDQV
jgi:hypothetical protein